jgi:hypothetical protein
MKAYTIFIKQDSVVVAALNFMHGHTLLFLLYTLFLHLR